MMVLFLAFILVAFIAACLFFLIIVGNINFPWIDSAAIKGRQGESRIANILGRLSGNYYVINDLFIEQNGYSIQIDHVVISEYGIFVIETKNYSGWILGSEDSEYWTKSQFGTRYSFYNPIRQNEAHIKALQNVLVINSRNFIPIVVFLGKADIKVNTRSTVLYSSQLMNYIRSYNIPILTTNEKDDIYRKLISHNILDLEKRKQHLASIQKNVNRKNETVQKGKCPRCDGTLVLRTGKYGKFWGCSNYPKCRYISK